MCFLGACGLLLVAPLITCLTVKKRAPSLLSESTLLVLMVGLVLLLGTTIPIRSIQMQRIQILNE